ncbi:MAG: excinuclease ABC subunit A [Waddliaceae bacterium]|nr:excinuclease ABC subunit A [Waddliaceae bacterium]
MIITIIKKTIIFIKTTIKQVKKGNYSLFLIEFEHAIVRFMEQIRIRACRQNNLKGLSLDLPLHKIIVITGVSGSGKSSLALDTLHTEGQRRYLACLSSQLRQSLKQIPKPDFDSIEGLGPTLALFQQRLLFHPQTTVASHTDLYDLLALLFARIGEQYSPATGKKLQRLSRQEIVENILKRYPEKTKLQLIAPIQIQDEALTDTVSRLQRMGYVKFRLQKHAWDPDMDRWPDQVVSSIDVVVDRISMREGIRERLSQSIETILDLSKGVVEVQEGHDGDTVLFTEIYVCPESGLSFAPLDPADFRPRSKGACPHCQGKKGRFHFLNDQVQWNPKQNIDEQVTELLRHFSSRQSSTYQKLWVAYQESGAGPGDKLLKDLSDDEWSTVLEGDSHPLSISLRVQGEERSLQAQWKGLIHLIEEDLAQKKEESLFYGKPYCRWKECALCLGSGLKQEVLFCRIEKENIVELCQKPIKELLHWFSTIKLTGIEESIANELVPLIKERLQFFLDLGLDYLELGRLCKELSEGEAQRVHLAAQVAAKLSGVLYILDEPSHGLHSHDIQYLQNTLKHMKEQGNSLLLVEHNPMLIRQADHLVEIGPGAGVHGGKLCFQGTLDELLKSKSVSSPWLNGSKRLPAASRPRRSTKHLQISNVDSHNLKNLNLQIPLGILVGFCGVSGSGKSSLLLHCVANELQRFLQHQETSKYVQNPEEVSRVLLVNQERGAVNTRSIPATYIGIMNTLRRLLSETKLAKARGYDAGRFSLNKRGGRCDGCEGLGQVRVRLEFLSDLYVPCELCDGKRFNYETLQVAWNGKNISEILEMTAEEALEQFQAIPDIASKLRLMVELGLDYLTLGQAFHTLSGGEIQRLKLVTELSKENEVPTLFILDEPSSGLHFEDTEKLLQILHRLVDSGHSVYMIEHRLELLEQCDYLIELGPGAGPNGGEVVFQGPPKNLLKKNTRTGVALKEHANGV